MKIYTNIVYDKDDNIIEEQSYNYNGPVSQARQVIDRRKSSKNHSAVHRMLNKDFKLTKSTATMSDAQKQHTSFNGANNNTSNGEYSDVKRTKNDTFLTDISDPNQLFKYASYNALFTLSALRQSEMESPKTMLNSTPHDIIIRSSGIGPHANMKEGQPGEDTLSPENRKIVDSNKQMKEALEKSQSEFQKNNDLYFKNVELNCVPGHNEERRLTSVTKIQMEIVEPWGITLLERIRAAAANNGYLDHLDAPYLLTINFAGWDEKGNAIPDEAGRSLKRVIPIKLTSMELDLNQGGTVYLVTAIPYNEFAYVDRYATIRTTGSIIPKNKTYGSIVNELEKILNKQTKDETGEINEKPDIYRISIDAHFKPNTTVIEQKYLQELPMYSQAVDIGVLGPEHLSQNAPDAAESRRGPEHLSHNANAGVDFMKITVGNNITKVLEEIMKNHPMVNNDKFKEWETLVKRRLREAQAKGGAQGVYEAAKNKGSPDQEEMHFISFRIKSSVISTTEFDKKRKTNVKILKYVVEPYKIHAYSLAIPGVSTGKNFEAFVHKTYNYLFTGENVDILDLNIKYKVAYFTAQLKNVGSASAKTNVPGTPIVPLAGTDSQDNVQDQTFLLRGEAGIAQSSGTGRTGESTTALDQFLDYLTHPKADMVVVRMEILGDPAWISQSQFMPADPKFIAPGTSADASIDAFRANKNYLWNDKLHCYNADIAEPIILLNYRMPTDINDKKGTYELQNTQSATFSGLYRVVQVEHNFNEGKYTNVLHMVRFNNQGVAISKPYTEYKAYTINNEIHIGSKSDILNQIKKGFSISNIIDIGISKIKNKVTKTVNKIKERILG